MSVFKRKSQHSETREYHYKFMQGGKWFYGVCEGCTTERDALSYEKQIKETAKNASQQKNIKALLENYRQELTGGTSISLAEAFSRYANKPRTRTASERQLKTNRSYWNDFLVFMTATFPEVKNLSAVTRPMTEAYIMYLRQNGPFQKEIFVARTLQGRIAESSYTPKQARLPSPRTVNARHKALKAVFAWLADDAGLSSNPFEIPTMKSDTIGRDAFSDEELYRIGSAMTMPYIKPVFIIGLHTGLTLGDICLLRWREIEGDWITGKRRRKTGTQLEIPILPPLAAFLDEQRNRTGGGEYVSPELADMYQTNPTGVETRIKNFLEGLHIQTTRTPGRNRRAVSVKGAHAMRHTFAYLSGMYNIPISIVQSILGHMTPAMTELYQRHANRKDKVRFLHQLPNMFGGSNLSGNTPTLSAVPVEPERLQLHQLVDQLPMPIIKKLLKEWSNLTRRLPTETDNTESSAMIIE